MDITISLGVSEVDHLIDILHCDKNTLIAQLDLRHITEAEARENRTRITILDGVLASLTEAKALRRALKGDE